MNYLITPSEDGNYIIMKVIGDIISDEVIKMNIEATAMGKKLGITKYLIDVTESKNISPIYENYKFAYIDLPVKSKIDHKNRIAILVDPDDHSHDFVETVLKNAGSNSTIFRDRELAIQHLLKLSWVWLSPLFSVM